jgi:hypothetical protein
MHVRHKSVRHNKIYLSTDACEVSHGWELNITELMWEINQGGFLWVCVLTQTFRLLQLNVR